MTQGEYQVTDTSPCMICSSPAFEPVKTSSWTITGVGEVPVQFGLCRNCGHICQNPCPDAATIEAFYLEMSNYYVPDPNWKPPKIAVSATTRRLVETARRHRPEKGLLYEVGCGTGRDLHYFQRDGWQVAGCEPSPDAGQQAKALTGADIDIGFADQCLKGDRTYGAMVLSHVLEHVTDPRAMLELIHAHLDDDGLFIVEVPCARQAHQLCLGWFTLEHLSYFSTDILVRLLEETGFLPIEIIIDDCSNKYPTITVACRKSVPSDTQAGPYFNGYAANRHMLDLYLARDRAHWQAVEARFAGVTRAYIYAAGVHTAQLMSETDLLNRVEILGIADSSPLKVGKRQGAHEIISKEALLKHYAGEDIIVSSHNSETVIAEMLIEAGVPSEKVIRLYT